MIIGTGVDIVAVNRIKDAETKWGKRFLNRIFTENELRYSFNHKIPHMHLAARFASKEAVMKALGTGHSNGVVWKDIEVINKESGKPEIRLQGRSMELAQKMGIVNIHLSIAHDASYAIAQVVMEGS